MLHPLDSQKSYAQLMKRLDTPSVPVLTSDQRVGPWREYMNYKKRNSFIFRVSQLKQARLKSKKKQKWDRLQVLPLSLDKNVREYLSERYALLTAKRLDCLRSAFSPKVRPVLISSSAITNHDILLFRD